MSPRRIQRKRTKGWRMPEGAVYVGRGSWAGNPFRVYRHCKGPDGDWGIEDTGRLNAPLGNGWTRLGAATMAVANYRQILDEVFPPETSVRWSLVYALRDRDLVCWCPLDQPCHADVLLEVANPGVVT